MTLKKDPEFSYEDAIAMLNSLQSRQSSQNKPARYPYSSQNISSKLPDMIDFLKAIDLKASELNFIFPIHIAGTKGKGSTTAFVESILLEFAKVSGGLKKIGVYTSPHLIQVRERIRLNGSPISPSLFSKYFKICWDKLHQALSDNQISHLPGYFQFLTLLCFYIFHHEKVDASVIEVGIGGEYDCTNIIPQPITCGISSLGYDHQGILGNTIQEIAWNKAGIIKRDVNVFSVEQAQEASKVIEERAAERNAPLKFLAPFSNNRFQLGVSGDHQNINAALAVALSLDFLQKQNMINSDIGEESDFVQKGLSNAFLPGRSQTLILKDFPNLKWYIDGAHTAESIQACMKWFLSSCSQKKNTKRILFFNAAHGRDGKALLTLLLQSSRHYFNQAYFCPNITARKDGNNAKIDSNLDLQREYALLAEQVGEINKHAVFVLPTINEAVNHLIQNFDSCSEKCEILVTGSLHLVGGVLDSLNYEISS